MTLDRDTRYEDRRSDDAWEREKAKMDEDQSVPRYRSDSHVVTTEGERGTVISSGTDYFGEYVIVRHANNWICCYSPGMLYPDWNWTDGLGTEES